MPVQLLLTYFHSHLITVNLLSNEICVMNHISYLDRRRREAAARASNNPRGDGLNAHRRGNRPPRLPGPGIPVPSGAGGSASTVGLNPMGPITTTATETSSMLSSDVESSLYEDTEDINSMASSSRFTTSTEHTSVSRNMINMRHRQKKRSRRKVPNAQLARAGSISSITGWKLYNFYINE